MCDSPVLVRPVRGRGIARRKVVQRDPRHDVSGPSTRPIATDAQQCAVCQSTRPIAICYYTPETGSIIWLIDLCHLQWPWVTLKVIRLLRVLSKAIRRTFVRHFGRFNWHGASRVPSAIAELLVGLGTEWRAPGVADPRKGCLPEWRTEIPRSPRHYHSGMLYTATLYVVICQ